VGAQLLLPEQLEELDLTIDAVTEEEPVSGAFKNPTLCDPDVKQYSGYVDVGQGLTGKKSLFFWMFESRSAPATDPLVMWLSGGPGCSSQLALLGENGPCVPTSDGKSTTRNPHSWHNKANAIWVDSPAGTGFSTGFGVTNSTQVADDLYVFLQGLFEQLPQFRKNPFYVTGESYAGHYVPATAARIVEGNKAAAADKKINLAGIAIGNGLVQPQVQYSYYWQMGKDGGASQGGSFTGTSPINSKEDGLMRVASVPCIGLIKSCNAGSNLSALACPNAYVECNYGELIPYQLTGYNPYDMRIKCEKPPLCYDFSPVQTFLNDPATKEALGVTKSWTSCNRLINMGFQQDWMKNYGDTHLPEVLAAGIRVLVYAGDVDFICNWLGNKAWTLAMEWPHKQDFNSAKDEDYTLDGKKVGRMRTASGLTFAQIFQAGHMVPRDQPAVAADMIETFIKAQSVQFV